ncbi:rRNA N-glycosidase [Striga asiatica]|uniref:rRNA N-glycosylase n=1 Tax=Striga asiatica TaxID=4170 RepID=A0A5A7PT34_STRAF|nr:rRNA N-glycosidase [Striga asiatica]
MTRRLCRHPKNERNQGMGLRDLVCYSGIKEDLEIGKIPLQVAVGHLFNKGNSEKDVAWSMIVIITTLAESTRFHNILNALFENFESFYYLDEDSASMVNEWSHASTYLLDSHKSSKVVFDCPLACLNNRDIAKKNLAILLNVLQSCSEWQCLGGMKLMVHGENPPPPPSSPPSGSGPHSSLASGFRARALVPALLAAAVVWDSLLLLL